jgi:hypothetical protein
MEWPEAARDIVGWLCVAAILIAFAFTGCP